MYGNKNPAKRLEVRKKIKEKRKYQKNVYESKIEKKFQKILEINKIDFKKHKYISDIEHSYQCDILIKPNIVIECDGIYYHNFPYGNKIDHIRTKEMREKGYIVFRFWEHEINNNIQKCINEVLEEIK